MKREQFTENEARDAIKAIIDAISYIHDMNIVHRDIKPENLLIKSKDLDLKSLKISDFGLARFVKTEQMANTTCGTPGYVAPEILMEKPYNKACDFWSIGVVLFILLSGTPPFFEDESQDLFDKIKTCDYNFSESTWKNVSDEAKDLVSKILKADPNERYNTDQMMDHPWMTKKLDEDKNLKMGSNLNQYIKSRKENKVVDGEDDEEI